MQKYENNEIYLLLADVLVDVCQSRPSASHNIVVKKLFSDSLQTVSWFDVHSSTVIP